MKERNNEEEKEEKPFNVILLGNIESEKEALIHKLIKKRFAINQLINQNTSNINTNQNISDIMNSVDIHGETVKMKIYDNTSASKIFSYSNKSLSSAQGLILFYSVCDRNSYNILKSNLHKIMSMNKYDFPMVMVGNDSDSPNRQVNYEEAKSLADSYGLKFYEVSINSGFGIKPMFEDLGEQVVYKKYGIDDNFGKNNKSMILNENKNNFSEKMVNKKSKNKNITIYTNNQLYENEFNKNIKEKMQKNKLTSNSYIINANTSSYKKNKLKTNYKTFTNESKSDLELENSINSSINNKKFNKSKDTFLFKSPDLTSSSVILSYRGKTEAQKKREEEIRQKRLLREKEMKTWWKKREKENLELQRLKKEKEKLEMKEKIKLDKRIQKEKEKKFIEENLMKVKLNYEQKKLNNRQMEQEILNKRENIRKEKLQEKKINKERLNKIKEEKEKEEKEKEKQLLNYKNIKNNKEKNQGNISKNTQTNSLNNKKRTEKLKSEKNKNSNNDLIQNNSCILKEEQNDTSTSTHIYENKNELIESYKNNSNIYRCLKCRLIPDILINESNQEIEIICDHSYEDYLHHNITSYSNFIEQSLNHPIDNNNVFCLFCQKYANEFSDEKNIFFCQKCDIYFCSDDEEKHKNLIHKTEENIKEKYLNISKNKIKEKNINKKNSKLMMTPTRNKLNKTLAKQNTTPCLSKKTNNKIIQKNSNNNKDANKSSENFHINENNNKNYKAFPFYLIDSYCGKHNEVFKFYCFNCHQNFCELCSNYHMNHSFVKFDDILLSNDELNSKKKELNKAKEDLIKLNEYFSALIEAIKCKFERLFNIKKKELEIKEKIILDYETIKYNYHSINNIRNIKFENNDKFLELNPNADWFTRFNLIFKNLNTNLSKKENDIFDILKLTCPNERNNTKIISKNYYSNKINKLIFLKNEDIAALNENKNIIIFDKDNFEEKLNINISKENNLCINDIIPRLEGGIILTGYEFIKFINLDLDNQYYNFEHEIKDSGSNINSLLEFNNSIFISLNDFSILKLWKKNDNYKYSCIDLYNHNNIFHYNREITQIIKINAKSFLFCSSEENCLYKFIINKNDKIELISKLENIYFIKGIKDNNYNYNNIINLVNEKYIFVSCIDHILLIDKNKFNIIQKFFHNYKLINLYHFSENYFIALDSKNILHKIEFDKYQQKLFFEDNINLNDNYPEFNSGLNNIIIWNREKIIFEMKDKFIKISSLE